MRNDVTFAPQWVRDAELDLEDQREDRMRLVRRIVGILVAGFILAGGIGYCVQAIAQPLDKPMLLVATPALQAGYRGTVIFAAPLAGTHIGFILNRPSPLKLGQLFPEHPPSAAVTDPVYIGGPHLSQAIFALVRGESPHPSAIELAPGIWIVSRADAVDLVIETKGNQARYFVGFVGWRPGELAAEIERGVFVLRPFDPAKLFLPDTRHLHDELAPKKGHLESIRRSAGGETALLVDWLCECVLNGPTLPEQPLLYPTPRQTHGFAPILEAFRLSAKGDQPIPARVSRLLASRGPSAILGFVMPVVVAPFDGAASGRFSHVGEEVLESAPALANRDAAGPVVLVRAVFLVATTGQHAQPASVSAGPSATLCAVAVLMERSNSRVFL